MAEPTISIIIRCYNEERHIRRLLEAVQAQDHRDYEIIVVDSGSTDRTRDIARQYDVRMLRIAPEDFSFGRALNLGCQHAIGRFLVFVSGHVYPTTTQWLRKLIEPFADPRVALVYGKQRGNEVTAYFEHRLFQKLYPDTSNFLKSDPFCNNACAAIRREVWERFPYDEDLTGLEDIAWAQKVLSEGYFTAYSAEAEIIHVHEETSAQRFNRYRREAIALKRIFPDSHFTVLDFLRLYVSNCLSDIAASRKDRVLTQMLPEILRTRWDQFAGTLSGYRLQGEPARQMKMRFFYPDFTEDVNVTEQPAPTEAPEPSTGSSSLPRIVALVPIRTDSKRVPNKNFRPFNGKPLYYHIINSLLQCPYIQEVYVNTNSEMLLEELPGLFERVRTIPRPANLCADTVPMNDILLHDVGVVNADWYLQTHVTNPLLSADTIGRAVEMMLSHPEHDSLFSVTPLYTRLWTRRGRPLNHNPLVLMRTQDLEPVLEENSNIYLFQAETLKARGSRIGEHPLLFEISREEAWDIDEEIDFRVAEFLHAQLRKS